MLVPFLKREPRWLLLGGPADGNEAQTARELWPDVRVVGVEPNPDAVAFQLANGWPRNCPLVMAALSNVAGGHEVVMVNTTGTPRHARGVIEGDDLERSWRAPATTWDAAEAAFGPFTGGAVMWLDLDGAELSALQGSVGLFRHRAVDVVNVEMQDVFRDRNEMIEGIMGWHGFRAVHEWNASATCRDRVYVREGR